MVKPEDRFGLGALERQQKNLQDAQKPAPLPQDGFSTLGRTLVNLPWVLLAVAAIIWWLKK